MISTELYIQEVNVFDNGINGGSTYDNIRDNSKSWITDQWVNYYVIIVSGTGAGQEALITSNDDIQLNFDTLPITLDTTSVYEIYAYQYNRIELYNDEKISITQTLQDSNDIGKLFTDYTQSFTVPASKHNNQLFKYWYNTDLDNGFDHRTRQKAYIEINTQPFKKGQLQLEKVNKKNGFIDSYTLTFYGNLTQLKDLFKDDKLNTLVGYETLNHEYNSDEVVSRIQNNYDVSYPLISSDKKYTYKDATDFDVSTETGAVVWDSLFPAIPMYKVFDFIQDTYGITFTGSFFLLNQWTELFLYLKNAEKLVFNTEPLNIEFSSKDSGFDELDLATNKLTTNFDFGGATSSFKQIIIQIRISPTTAENYSLLVYKNGTLLNGFNDLSGEQLITCDVVLYNNSLILNDEYYFTIQSENSITFDLTLYYYKRWITSGGVYTQQLFNAVNTDQNTVGNIPIRAYVPDIKISDFVQGIIKAFNLRVIPTDLNTFEFIPLEEYYLSGKTTDITQYVYAEEMETNRPVLYKSINFEYEKSTNILNNFYSGLYGKEYGDLIYQSENSNESEIYEIKLPFENVLFDKTVDENFLTATIVDKDQKPYTPKPMLIYNNDSTLIDITYPILVTKDVGGFYELNVYNRFSNEYNAIPSDVTLSELYTMNFNNEQSPWYNVVAPRGLYSRFYANYVENLYNIRTRNIKVNAILPPSLISKDTGIKLNERLIISGRRYIINSFTTDLTTGETNFDLVTDYRGVNAVSTVGYRYANLPLAQIDAEIQTINFVIYLNDYDKFDIQPPVDFLDYTPETDLDQDFNLEVFIDKNFGAERTDSIVIDYYKNGTIELTETIFVIQAEIL
ncbi:hypothetical protein UFOVP388_38 [uncultured Caudovirales phage]|uniref:Uncharacterized protein n=1 Tax=uncultured Caudovirales phage TaxID=2100421 RepID=A0A6J7X9E3_9CAUD|nr:hypothetical protein UFOVP388_38 [uncultured Caudovirales phage]